VTEYAYYEVRQKINPLVTYANTSPSPVFLSFKPRLHDTTGCQTVKQPAECLFSRCSRLFNRFDNRLYRVNGVLELLNDTWHAYMDFIRVNRSAKFHPYCLNI